MSDQEPKPLSADDAPLSPRIDDTEVKAELTKSAQTPFEADNFLNPEIRKPHAATPSPSSVAPQVVKRGGIGFFTAFLMSGVAVIGGASLALFAMSRPDLLRQAGLSALVPAPPTAPSLGTNTGNLSPLLSRVDAIEAELVVLKAQLEGRAAAGLPQTSPQTPQVPNPVPAPALSKNDTPTAPTGNIAGDVGSLKSELAGVSGRMTAIETRIAALDPTGAGGAVIASLQTEIATLKALVSGLQQQVASAPSPTVTFALVGLVEAANRSTPFVTEFETLRAALPNAPEVNALEGFARTGVPTQSLLAERLAPLEIGASNQSGAKTANQNGFLTWLGSLFSNMITVEPASKTEGSSDEAMLARAQTKMDEGDLAASVAEISRIQAPSPEIATWLDGAQQRLELNSRVAALRGIASRPNNPATNVPPVAPPIGSPPAPVSNQN